MNDLSFVDISRSTSIILLTITMVNRVGSTLVWISTVLIIAFHDSSVKVSLTKVRKSIECAADLVRPADQRLDNSLPYFMGAGVRTNV